MVNSQVISLQPLSSIGANPLTAVELYKEAIVIGKGLINSVDDNKLQKLNRFKKIIFIKETGIAFIIGFLSGVVANAFWGYNSFWDFLHNKYNAASNYLSNILNK